METRLSENQMVEMVAKSQREDEKRSVARELSCFGVQDKSVEELILEAYDF